MFSGINFGRHDFRFSSFKQCLMIGCDFENADLKGVDFSKAIIDGTTIFENATFENTRVTQQQRLYLEKWTKKGLVIVDNEAE